VQAWLFRRQLLYPLSYQGSCGASDSSSDLRLLRSLSARPRLAHRRFSIELVVSQPMTDARIDPLVRSFERSLRAERKSERTIKTYFEALEQLSALLHERGRGLADATTADIQDYIIDVIERRRPSTANNRFRSLHRFYAWLEDEEEIPNPMRRLKPPPVPEDALPVLDDDALRRLLETFQGRGFEERRDAAILYLFLDAGPRLESHLRPSLARRRRQRDRPHAPGRLALPQMLRRYAASTADARAREAQPPLVTCGAAVRTCLANRPRCGPPCS
jgi:Phage integrase, N-terminal SAM-like domain